MDCRRSAIPVHAINSFDAAAGSAADLDSPRAVSAVAAGASLISGCFEGRRPATRISIPCIFSANRLIAAASGPPDDMLCAAATPPFPIAAAIRSGSSASFCCSEASAGDASFLKDWTGNGGAERDEAVDSGSLAASCCSSFSSKSPNNPPDSGATGAGNDASCVEDCLENCSGVSSRSPNKSSRSFPGVGTACLLPEHSPRFYCRRRLYVASGGIHRSSQRRRLFRNPRHRVEPLLPQRLKRRRSAESKGEFQRPLIPYPV